MDWQSEIVARLLVAPEYANRTIALAVAAQRAELSGDIGFLNRAVKSGAVEGLITLTQLLVTQDLKCFATEVSTAARSMRSTYATPEEVARVIKKPVSYVLAQPAA